MTEHGPLEKGHRGVVGGGVCKGGGRIVAASEMLRPSVEACSASRSDAPGCKK
jgi:hypothetical protein